MKHFLSIAFVILTFTMLGQSFTGIQLSQLLPSDYNFTVVSDVTLRTNGQAYVFWSFDMHGKKYEKITYERYQQIQYYNDSSVYVSGDFNGGRCYKVDKIVKDTKGGILSVETIELKKPEKAKVAWGRLISIPSILQPMIDDVNPTKLCVNMGKNCVPIQYTSPYENVVETNPGLYFAIAEGGMLRYIYGRDVPYELDKLLERYTASNSSTYLHVSHVNDINKVEDCVAVIPFWIK